ncbi:oxidoreductase [Photobacterium proteolyticum]|uniref:Oxidoreductase n=1 Tax=Photobacterium proteolyticum TaxID=1903952 RepID=A0A1Q9G679_9GAMM|nr:molybdopterin-dependent oxidoreductase [Photobacterium proteolyticum]OLQ69486.1 oxidoreductase [Photobacterium proteolyticum]
MSVRLSSAVTDLIIILLCIFASASSLAYETTLTISGLNSSGQQVDVTLNRSELEKLPQTTLTTHLPWIKGQAEFEGVKLTTLLRAYQLKPTQVLMSALNDYSASSSWKHISKYEPIIAIKKNNQYLKIRDYGPYWLVFSIDKYPELGQRKNLAKMVWQLETIKAE